MFRAAFCSHSFTTKYSPSRSRLTVATDLEARNDQKRAQSGTTPHRINSLPVEIFVRSQAALSKIRFRPNWRHSNRKQKHNFIGDVQKLKNCSMRNSALEIYNFMANKHLSQNVIKLRIVWHVLTCSVFLTIFVQFNIWFLIPKLHICDIIS
jgi:hypothetical protein